MLTADDDSVELQPPSEVNLTSKDSRTGLIVRICMSHLLAKWAFQMWDYVLPLIIQFVFPNTLLPAAIIFFGTTIACIIFAPYVGAWIDRQPRLRVVRLGLFGQNISILISGTMIWVLLQLSVVPTEGHIFATWQTGVAFCMLICSAALGDLSMLALDISVERDWVPVCIPVAQLPTVNAWMSRIDLLCETAAPIVVGLLLSYASYTPSFLAVAVWNWASTPAIYLILASIYRRAPALATQRSQANATDELSGNSLGVLFSGWGTFAKQRVALVMVANAFLWLTVLSPHSPILTQFLIEREFKLLEVSIFRASGAIFGVGSTFLFPIILDASNLVTACGIHIALEGVMLCVAMLAFFAIPYVSYSRYAFLVAIIFSRIGLYGFCIGYVQVLQTGIDEDVRGVVNSVDKSFTRVALLVVYAGVMIFHTSDTFPVMIYGSVITVNSGAILYWLWSSRKENRDFILSRQLPSAANPTINDKEALLGAQQPTAATPPADEAHEQL